MAKCLTCPKIAVYRGCCYQCYSWVRRDVEKGETTWEKAEQEGRCLPRAKGHGNREGLKVDPLKPSASLLCKLGSIAVHADEMMSPHGHHFDKAELQQRLADPEVQAWLEAMGPMVPVKRIEVVQKPGEPLPPRKTRVKK